jgi:glycosyltransferase involved in cell wall biosynthesis
MSAVVIIPVTGSPECRTAIESVLNQTYPTTCYVVCDGQEYVGKVQAIVSEYLGNPNLKICYLPENVGANGFYGHRVYAAFSHLVKEDYVLFLDQDVFLERFHVQRCVETIEENNLDWCYSLRSICDKDGKFICTDDCESLGKWQAWTHTYHIDTNCYCVKRDVMTKIASVWHGGWGQDRVFFATIAQHFNKFDCTGKYTVNYRLAGNEGSVTKEFFIEGNMKLNDYYKGKLPWRKS